MVFEVSFPARPTRVTVTVAAISAERARLAAREELDYYGAPEGYEMGHGPVEVRDVTDYGEEL